jgi:hypothetical protein
MTSQKSWISNENATIPTTQCPPSEKTNDSTELNVLALVSNYWRSMQDCKEEEAHIHAHLIAQDSSCCFISRMREFFSRLENDWHMHRERQAWEQNAVPRQLRQLKLHNDAAVQRIKTLRESEQELRAQLSDARSRAVKLEEAHACQLRKIQQQLLQAHVLGNEKVEVYVRKQKELAAILQEDRLRLVQLRLSLRKQEEANLVSLQNQQAEIDQQKDDLSKQRIELHEQTVELEKRQIKDWESETVPVDLQRLRRASDPVLVEQESDEDHDFVLCPTSFEASRELP